ncbi:hypothetical protein Glove_174g188 [Diversispora epigaea]|uniref:C2 domain-containing protein n=1 Tax=Diversispora epigaea TaxID=1348612 RepID=A0A397IRU9_9GLOM|nr:hypothetical protein Glove_174g188 [Diversispora epigaea]
MSRKIGELVVVVISAKNLMSPDVVGKADPYATFRVAEVLKRTKTDKRGGQHPEWDEEVRFDITDEPKSKKLEVEIYNEDVREPDFIGSTKIDLQKVLSKGEQDEWFEIKSRANKFAGEILLEMTFYNTNVLPLQVKKPNSTPSQNSNLQYSQINKPATHPITNSQFGPPIVNNPIASPPTQSSVIYSPPVSQSTPLYPPPSTQYPPQTSSYIPSYPSYSSPPPSLGPNTNTSPIMSSAQVGGLNSLGFPVPVPTPNVSTNLSNISNVSMGIYPPVNSAIIPPVNSTMNPAMMNPTMNPAMMNPTMNSAMMNPTMNPYQTYPPNNIYPPPNNNNIYPPPNNTIYPPPVGQQGYYNQGNSYPSSGQH